jgi:hypothetical protein
MACLSNSMRCAIEDDTEDNGEDLFRDVSDDVLVSFRI